MADNPGSLQKIRRIDNSRVWLPLITTILIIFLVVIFYWTFRGDAFRLYASVFFTLYRLTGLVWVSVLLIGIVQNLVFLPVRFIGNIFWHSIDQFEEELEHLKNDNDQYLLFKDKIKKGNVALVFWIFNFIINAIAFISAGRIFLIDFYTQKLDPSWLFSWAPYPDYPLKGTLFYFPFFKITQTFALQWGTIFKIWIGIIIFFALLRLLWQPLKLIFGGNQKLLSARINYNRLLLQLGGFSSTTFILSLIILRHLPVNAQSLWLVADLTRQNTTMNTITAIGTFITTLHAGFTRQSKAAADAVKANIPETVINRVFREKMRQSFKNAILLGLGAFLITNQIPCAFELSVATFEILYILSPYTFDKLVEGPKPSPPVVATASPPTALI